MAAVPSQSPEERRGEERFSPNTMAIISYYFEVNKYYLTSWPLKLLTLHFSSLLCFLLYKVINTQAQPPWNITSDNSKIETAFPSLAVASLINWDEEIPTNPSLSFSLFLLLYFPLSPHQQFHQKTSQFDSHCQNKNKATQENIISKSEKVDVFKGKWEFPKEEFHL